MYKCVASALKGSQTFPPFLSTRWRRRSKEAIICSVSHAWEAREHPDAAGYQLEQVASHASLFAAAFAADIWIFFDYTSLFQFDRQTEAEKQSFELAMGNMHAMYSHESTMTFRIESLTPEYRWEKAIKDGSTVTIYHAESREVKPVPVQALTRNKAIYLQRGWCRAEVSWSCGRGATAQHQRIDVGVEQERIDPSLRQLTGLIPAPPKKFAEDMDSAEFTHRADSGAVIDLQRKVYLEKVSQRKELTLEGLPVQQMRALIQALPYFRKLNSIALRGFCCGEDEAKEFVEAGLAPAVNVNQSVCL